jgi:hypothetical protein
VSAFADLDAALDTRYEQSLAALGPAGDPDPFDGQGVIGMHAVERILFAPGIPQPVIDLESTLPGRLPAAWPATANQLPGNLMHLCPFRCCQRRGALLRTRSGIVRSPGQCLSETSWSPVASQIRSSRRT